MNWDWSLFWPILIGAALMIFAVYVKYQKTFDWNQIVWRAALGVAVMIALVIFVDEKWMIRFAVFLATVGLIYFISWGLDRLKRL
jgi:hypothetical protein